MAVTTYVLGVVCLLAVFPVTGFIVCVLYMHYLHHKYAHIPASPRQGFFSGHLRIWTDYRSKDGCFDDMLLGMVRECGPVFHIFIYFLPLVVVVDPEFVKEVLSKNDHRKPYVFYRDIMKVCGTRFAGSGLVTQLDRVKHAKKRAMFTPAFHRKYLQSLMAQFNACADVLIERLSHKADGKTEVAMLDELNRTTLDVIAKVAFGLDLKQERNGDALLNKAMKTVTEGIAASLENPFIELSPFAADRKLRKEVKQSIHIIRETGRECIERRRDAILKGEKVPQDILTYILKGSGGQAGDETIGQAGQEASGLTGDEAMEMEDILDEFTTFFLAGQDTTANLLSFTLVELGHHPEIMHRLRTEVEAVVGETQRVEYNDIGKLHYMMQVFKETLRLWPPVTVTSRQMAYNVSVKGVSIPAKTSVVMSTYVMARMEEYFHDPLQFDPDRFKNSDDRRPGTYIPFSLGARSCIGQQFAMIISRVLLARLLQKFHFTMVPGQDHELLADITLKPKGRCRNYISMIE